jgi:beta-galactosidase
MPYYGWHWGNRGGVATGAIEKPHHSAWRPLMQCEFDMAYSPLNELPYKKGQLVWCQLDLEDHYNEDVIAATMMTRLLNYVDTLRTKDRTAPTILLGNNEDEALLLDLGMQFIKREAVPSNAGLLIVGNISAAQQSRVKQFATAGGKVLVLPRNNQAGLFGVQYKTENNFKGASRLPQWPSTQGLSVSDTRYRVDYPKWLISSGCEVAADGLVGRLKTGNGEMIFVQFDPRHLPADTLTYLRFSRWRQTRALVQVAANMGASFIMDRALFETPVKQVNSILIEGDWKAIMTKPLPASKTAEEKHKDPGISPEALKYMQTEADEAGMFSIKTGVPFEKAVPAWNNNDGEIVYRKIIDVPPSLIGEALFLHLGAVDDYDDVYINGKLVGKTGVEKEPVWNYNRTYTIPAGVLKEGANVMAIRVFDTYGGGGIMPSLKKREIVLKIPKKIPQLYHPDYIEDFEMGDDPFRYFRW